MTNLSARLKLIVMLGIALWFVAAGVRVEILSPWPGAAFVLPVMLGAAGSILWLVLVMNAVNFMDGANGLAMGMALIASAALGACAIEALRFDLALPAFAMAGALAGFLVWNVPGKLFAGDAGSLFVGLVLGGISLGLVHERPEWLFVPPLILAPFLSDVVLTLLWRARNRKPLFHAHRDHAYQIAIKAGLRHGQVSLLHAILAFNAAGMGVIAAIAGGRWPAARASPWASCSGCAVSGSISAGWCRARDPHCGTPIRRRMSSSMCSKARRRWSPMPARRCWRPACARASRPARVTRIT
jgi:UDP-N-acetylmuramyl pentapeptide phosphotransferase/UDP-N-acetylglucosamine-1-phosphate transferase